MKSTAAAYIVGSAIVVFLPGDVTDQHREDVCNSLDFSQRATRKQYPESEHMKQWEDAFSHSLSSLHWFQQSSDISGKFVEFYDLLKEMRLSDTEQKCVEDAIKALASKSENSDALKLFNDRVAMDQSLLETSQASNTDQRTVDQQTRTGETGKTQARYMIVVCSVTNGAIAARFTNCQFAGSTFLSDVLFPQFHRDAKIRISATTRGLNLNGYAHSRRQIKERLEGTGISLQSKIMLPK
ncbi:hypothetical protein BD779DRAFT_1802615 [Infundibulicybe gibba]|nr:hypothetical protein BD779DRAFT_1802615 [Infundibulicybe gibba]